MIIKIILCAVGSYLLGCINAAYIYSKNVKHTDIRSYGSGNAGSTNVLRVFGLSPALLVFICDLCKGIAAILLTKLITGGNVYGFYAAALAVVCGHNWPAVLAYRGGKGVATSVGVILALDYRVAVICLLIGLTVIFATRMVSAGSVSGLCLTPIVGLLLKSADYAVIIFLLLALLCVFQHRGNLKRIFAGTENKLTKRAEK